MQSAQALVLDFGGVISRTLFETHHLTEPALGLAPGSLVWRGPFDPASDPLWQDMLADKLSEREYWMVRTKEVGRLVGESWDKMETFVQRARGADVQAVIRPEAVVTILQAKAAGKRLAILSNELDLFYGADFRKRLPLLDIFDLVVDATYTHILKPDPRAYAFVTDQLGLAAADCVFVDDQLRNIQGGQKFGMQVVHLDVTQPGQAFARAAQRLGMA